MPCTKSWVRSHHLESAVYDYDENMSVLKRLLVSIYLIGLFPSDYCLSQRSIDPEIQGKIDDFVKSVYLPLAEISGLGLAVAKNDGEILYTTGFGQANNEKEIQIGNSTQFLIASISKSFTAVLTTKLLHETFPDLGETVLDTPIRKLLPQANFTMRDRFRSEHANFRDLLSHRLCLFRGDIIYSAEPFNTTDELLYRTRYSEEICGVRTEFQYNNEMYSFAGELAAILANTSFEEAMQGLLDDIGMTESTLLKKTDDFNQMGNRALPYYVQDGKLHPMNPDLIKREIINIAAGGIFATPNDMAKYMRFHLNFGNLDGKQIIPQEVMEWVRKPSNLISSLGFKESDDDKIRSFSAYSLGLMIGSYDGWEYIQHSGFIPPYLSLMSFYPGQNLSIFTSTNMGPRQLDDRVLHEYIFELLKGTPNATRNAEAFAMELKALEEEKRAQDKIKFQQFCEDEAKRGLSVHDKKNITGHYGSGSLGEVEVSEKFNEESNQTGTFLQYGKWLHGWLMEEVPNWMYKIKWVTDARHDDCYDGDCEGTDYARFCNGTLSLLTPGIGEETQYVYGTFKLGVRLELLPVVPWEPDSKGASNLT